MAKYSKRILYFGMPDMGLVCLSALMLKEFNIAAVVPPDKFNSSYKNFMNFIKGYNLNVIEYQKKLNEPDFLQKIKDGCFDIAVVCSYNKLFPNELLSLTKDGFINIHPSLLPEYRGPNPYSNVIINNEKYTGVTAHFMNDKFDCGDILAQIKIPISENDTMGTLFSRLNKYSAALLVKILSVYETNSLPSARKQPDGDYKYSQNYDISLGNTFIDWSQFPDDIDRFVRGLNPFIGAYTFFRDEYLRVNSVTIEKKKHNIDIGTVVDTSKGLKIACNSGFVTITSLQYGSLLSTDGIDFVKRFKIKKGEKVDNE